MDLPSAADVMFFIQAHRQRGADVSDFKRLAIIIGEQRSPDGPCEAVADPLSKERRRMEVEHIANIEQRGYDKNIRKSLACDTEPGNDSSFFATRRRIIHG